MSLVSRLTDELARLEADRRLPRRRERAPTTREDLDRIREREGSTKPAYIPRQRVPPGRDFTSDHDGAREPRPPEAFDDEPLREVSLASRSMRCSARALIEAQKADDDHFERWPTIDMLRVRYAAVEEAFEEADEDALRGALADLAAASERLAEWLR